MNECQLCPKKTLRIFMLAFFKKCTFNQSFRKDSKVYGLKLFSNWIFSKYFMTKVCVLSNV